MEQINEYPINLFDTGVIIIIFGSAIFAYVRGFIHEICSIAGWVGAILTTIYGFQYLQPYARQLIAMEILADLAAGALLFLSALVILSILTRKFSSRIRQSALNSLDRALGFLFGLMRGALMIVVAYIGLEFFIPHARQSQWIQTGRFIQFVKPAADFLISSLPENYALKRYKGDRTSADTAPANQNASSIVRELISPRPNTEAKQGREGYARDERQEMERLIRNTAPK